MPYLATFLALALLMLPALMLLWPSIVRHGVTSVQAAGDDGQQRE